MSILTYKDLSLEQMEEAGYLTIDENGLPILTSGYHYKHILSETEACTLLYMYISQDLTISTKKLSSLLNMNERTVKKWRECRQFKMMVANGTNDKLMNYRALAVDTLGKMLTDPTVPSGTRVKASVALLNHAERLSEIAIAVGQEKPISIDEILKELKHI